MQPCTKEREITEIHDSLKRLEPLVALANEETLSMIREIISEKKAASIVARKVIQIVGFLVSVCALIGGVLAIWKYFK